LGTVTIPHASIMIYIDDGRLPGLE
jgi:hypothetical protein